MQGIAIAIVADSDARQDRYCRESNVCFSCGAAKRVGRTLCEDCFVAYKLLAGMGKTKGLTAFLHHAWQVQAGKN